MVFLLSRIMGPERLGMVLRVRGDQGGVGMTLSQLQKDIGEWSDKTFGEGDRFRGTSSHLREEVEELIESNGNLDEFADCLMLLLDLGRMRGFNTCDLMSATALKLEINKERKWGKPQPCGKVNHIRATGYKEVSG